MLNTIDHDGMAHTGERESGYKYTHGEGYQKVLRRKGGTEERRGEVEPKESSNDVSEVMDSISSPPNPSPSSSQQRAEKEFIDKERRTLIGNAKLMPNVYLEENRTVDVKGLGKVLSGLYYVDEVAITFDTGKGVSKEAVLSKSGFKGSLRMGVDAPEPPRREKEKPKVEKKTHTIVAGDTLWALAVKHYGNGTQWRKIFNANKMKTGDERRLRIGRTIIIP